MRIVQACGALGMAALLSACSGLPVDPLGLQQEVVTTSIADAATDLTFLDRYNPRQGSLAGLVPRGPNGTLLSLPGLWEGTFWSYCLHAGVHQPGDGDGYAYAPLKGPDAQIIRHILQNQLVHPEVPQGNVQALIWAVLAKTRLSDSTPELKATAGTLLTAAEIDHVNGGAIGKIPPELLEAILSKLPPAARQLARTKADLRGLLTSAANVPYAQLEQIAAPLGGLPPPPDSRSVAVGRWSYDETHRVFVRYFPNGYTKTRVQFYGPESFTVDRDDQGRIRAIGDRAGNRVAITYKPDSGSAQVPGDPAIKLHSFASVELTGRDPQKPWESSTAALGDTGWVMTGVPNGNGRAAGPDSASVQKRYDLSVEQTGQTRKLQAVVRKRDPLHPPLNVEMLAEFGAYAAALEAISRDRQGGDALAEQGSGLFDRAWMSQAAAFSQPAAGAAPALPWYDPTGSVAQPGNTGKQRLSQSPADGCGANGADNIDFARYATKGLSGGTSVAWGLGTRAPNPFGIPLFGSMLIIDFQFDNMGKIIDGLSGRECPRLSAAKGVSPSMASFVPVTLMKAGEHPSADHVRAWSELAETSTALAAALEKAGTSVDRYRSALAAGDQVEAIRHARQMTAHLHASGRAMMLVSARLSAVAELLRADGQDQPVTLAAIRKYQQDLKAHGFSQQELDVAKSLGMSAEAIAAAYAARLEPVTGRSDSTIVKMYGEAVAALQELGRMLATISPAGEASTLASSHRQESEVSRAGIKTNQARW